MVLFLLKREETLKVALVFALFAPLVLLPGAGQPAVAWGFLGWLSFLLSLSTGRFRLDQRTTRFEVALPIAARHLLMVRMLGTLLTIWAPVSTACFALLLFRSRTAAPAVAILTQGAAVLTFAVVLPLTVRLGEAAISGWVVFNRWLSAAVLGATSWFFLSPPVHLIVFAGASAAILVWAWESAPASFQTSPLAVTQDHARLAPRIVMPAWWPIFRSALPGLGVVALIGGILAGCNIQFGLQLSLLLFQAGLFTRNRTRWLESFPLSHRTMLGLTLATTVAPFLIGVAFGTWVFQPNFVPRIKPLVGSGPGRSLDDSLSRTSVPLEYWRSAAGGRVPVIQAPWGETVRPKPVSILGFSFYNPYAVERKNSKQFVAWQFGNATEAVHGRRVVYENYYEVRDGLPKDAVVTRVDILFLGSLAFLLLVGVWFREFSLSHSLKRSTAFAQRLFVVPTAAYFACYGLDMFYNFRYNTWVTAPFLHVLFLRAASVLPSNLAVLSLLAALPSLGMYWLTERQFAKAEMTGPLMPALQSLGRGMEPQ